MSVYQAFLSCFCISSAWDLIRVFLFFVFIVFLTEKYPSSFFHFPITLIFVGLFDQWLFPKPREYLFWDPFFQLFFCVSSTGHAICLFWLYGFVGAFICLLIDVFMRYFLQRECMSFSGVAADAFAFLFLLGCVVLVCHFMIWLSF